MNKINSSKLADKIIDDLYEYFDGYYTSQGGHKMLIQIVKEAIDKEINIVKENS